MAVADRDAERERFFGERERAVELAFGAKGEREVVERGRACDGIVVLGREREALLELGARLGMVASTGREDAEDVVRLRERPRVGGPLREGQRLLRERLGFVVPPPPVRVEAPVGDDACRERGGGSVRSASSNELSASSHSPRRSWRRPIRCSTAPSRSGPASAAAAS